ncbi:hypothetical protein IQ235_18325, partial [Oscillatoriales cyanobacterium LEGE 11467]|nr:hypothetical protein [Zarconia navalis LEGE 11467]
MSNSNRLEATEYLCWASSAVGSAMAAFSGQFLYASVPLCCSLLLNLVNRRWLNEWPQRQMTGAIVRVHQQLSQDLQTFEQQVRGLPEPLGSKLDSTTPLISPVAATPSQGRLSQLDDLQLVYQEIVQLQEQYASLRDSLAGVVDYLNNSHLATKVSVLEQEIDRLYSHVRLIQQQLEGGSLPGGDPNSHSQEHPTLDSLPTALEIPTQRRSSHWAGEYEAVRLDSTAPSFTVSLKKAIASESTEDPARTTEMEASPVALPSFSPEPFPPTE